VFGEGCLSVHVVLCVWVWVCVLGEGCMSRAAGAFVLCAILYGYVCVCALGGGCTSTAAESCYECAYVVLCVWVCLCVCVGWRMHVHSC